MDRFGWDEATEWDYNQEAYASSRLDPDYEDACYCEEAEEAFRLFAIRDMDNLESYSNLIPHPMAWSWYNDIPF